MPKRNRLTSELRKDQVLDAALAQSALHGYNRVTRDQIAAAAGCSAGLVSLHFGTMPDLRRMIVRYAVRKADLTVLAQALAARDPHVKTAPEELKSRALTALKAV